MSIHSVTIITPVRNAAGLIARTAESIVTQSAVRSGRVKLQYIVCDGASTDETVAMVREATNGSASIVSEPDSGMYDALSKGLRMATGDIVAYLNAGDVYYPAAFDVVADVIEAGAEWVTGLKTVTNEAGHVTRVEQPYRYRRQLVECGAYGTVLPFIQQESTFWTRRLNEKIDTTELSRVRLAGDFAIWRTFARYAELRVVQSCLGAFAVHRGQQSSNIGAYRKEMVALRRRPTLLDWMNVAVDVPGWMALRAAMFIGRRQRTCWNHAAGRWGD